MSRKRRILIITEAAWSAVRQAMGYVSDVHNTSSERGGYGDVSNRWGASNEHVLTKIVAVAPMRDAHADYCALVEVLDLAIVNSCSCVSDEPLAGDGKHNPECHVVRHKHALDRVEAIRDLFFKAVR